MAENWGPTFYGGSLEGKKFFTPSFIYSCFGMGKNFSREGETPPKKVTPNCPPLTEEHRKIVV